LEEHIYSLVAIGLWHAQLHFHLYFMTAVSDNTDLVFLSTSSNIRILP